MRLETGVAQVDDDWPGIFIRGDNAIAYYLSLQQVLAAINPSECSPLHLAIVQNLAKLLASCDATTKPEAQRIRLARPEEKTSP